MSPAASAARPCHVACMQWNDLRDEIGDNDGTYDNPRDLTPASWTVMRFSEVELEPKSPRMADPQGRLPALRGSRLPESVPGPGRDRQIFERDRRLHLRKLHRPAARASPAVRSIFRAFRRKTTRPTSARCAPTGFTVGLEPACVKACPTGAIRFGTKDDMKEFAAVRVVDLKERGYQQAGLYDPAGVGGTHVSVRAAARRPAAAVPRPAGQPQDQSSGGALEGCSEAARRAGDDRCGGRELLSLHEGRPAGVRRRLGSRMKTRME